MTNTYRLHLPSMFIQTFVHKHCRPKSNRNPDGLVFQVPFNVIQVIKRQWKDDNERLCATKHHAVELTSASSRIQTWGFLIQR